MGSDFARVFIKYRGDRDFAKNFAKLSVEFTSRFDMKDTVCNS